MSLPEWVGEDRVRSSLVNYLQDKTIEITGMNSKPAVPVGDNYTSDLFRTSVNYTTTKKKGAQCISLIVKCTPDGGAKEMLAKEIQLFEKETEMFNVTIPKMHEILGDKYLAADCLYAQHTPRGLLIIQDLAPLGYRMAVRQDGLDMEHCFLVLEKIARWHASSAALFIKDPQSMENYFKGIYTNQHENKVVEQFLTSGFQSLITATSKWSGCQKYSDKLSAISDELFNRSVEVGIRRPGDFSVLNHGDLWNNNILFHYDSKGKVKDLKFVDFQLAVFTSPAIDLQYFIHTSPRSDIRQKHLYRLLEYYHEQLDENLRNLNYPNHKIPTYEQIKKDYFKRGFYGLVSAATVLPIVRAPKSDDATFEDLLHSKDNEPGFRQTLYNTDEYRSDMEDLLPYFDKQGLLD